MNSGSLEKWPAATVFAVKGAGSDRDPKAPTMDSDDEAHPSFEVPAVSAYAVDALKRMVVQVTLDGTWPCMPIPQYLCR